MTEPEQPNPEENLTRAEELLERLDEARSRLEAATDPDQAIEILSELSEIAKESRPRSQRRSATPMRSPDEHRERIEDFLAGLELSEELGRLDEVVRYALAGGGKRIRPVLCLATTEAAGGDPDQALAAAAALGARPLVLARPRRPSGAGRRRAAARPADRACPLRRGAGDPRRRCAPQRGVLAGTRLRGAARRTRARAGDVGDDRRAVPRHQRRPGRPPRAEPAQDGAAVRGLGRLRSLGRTRPRRRTAGLARVRRRVRRSLPGRGRSPRRRRAREGARAPGNPWSSRRRRKPARGPSWTRSTPTPQCSPASSASSRPALSSPRCSPTLGPLEVSRAARRRHRRRVRSASAALERVCCSGCGCGRSGGPGDAEAVAEGGVDRERHVAFRRL